MRINNVLNFSQIILQQPKYTLITIDSIIVKVNRRDKNFNGAQNAKRNSFIQGVIWISAKQGTLYSVRKNFFTYMSNVYRH